MMKPEFLVEKLIKVDTSGDTSGKLDHEVESRQIVERITTGARIMTTINYILGGFV